MPDSVRPAVAAFKDAGWWRIGMSEVIGGMPAPAPLTWAVNEMMICANPAIQWYSTPVMSQVLALVGTEQQKRWARIGLERGWTGTMALTKPDAGSDVGSGRTRAIPQPDGTWHIEGVKRFISGGDVGDTAENLFHLVLARPEGAGPGTKGLSMFYVPKYLFDPDTMRHVHAFDDDALGELDAVALAEAIKAGRVGGPLAGWTRDVGTDVWIACDDTIEDGRWARSPAAIHYSEEPGQGQGIDAAQPADSRPNCSTPQTSSTSTPTDIPLASSGAKGADLRFKSWPVG